MADSMPANVSPRARGAKIRGIPARWGFWKGLLAGAAIEVPALGGTVWAVSRLGVGDPEVELLHVLRLTAMFAGIAAVLTAGGIGRLAAYATADRGRPRAVLAAARAHAIASAGLVVIAAIPHGDLPADAWGWLGLAGAGLLPGALCGALIGVVCSGTAQAGLADVWSLAKRPSEALRQLLGPEDIADRKSVV